MNSILRDCSLTSTFWEPGIIGYIPKIKVPGNSMVENLYCYYRCFAVTSKLATAYKYKIIVHRRNRTPLCKLLQRKLPSLDVLSGDASKLSLAWFAWAVIVLMWDSDLEFCVCASSPLLPEPLTWPKFRPWTRACPELWLSLGLCKIIKNNLFF